MQDGQRITPIHIVVLLIFMAVLLAMIAIYPEFYADPTTNIDRQSKTCSSYKTDEFKGLAKAIFFNVVRQRQSLEMIISRLAILI